jgi:sulfoquinovosyltransferase
MMKGEALSQAYASADIFVMPSETETLGFVVLEAMASGVPVVAVAAGGLTDILTQPGKTGLLYAPGDYAAAAQLVKQLIADPEMRQRVSGARGWEGGGGGRMSCKGRSAGWVPDQEEHRQRQVV